MSHIVPLSAEHELDDFKSGEAALDQWLRRSARVNQAAGQAQVYVLPREQRVVGYYALAAGAVEHTRAPARVSKRLARTPIPVALLGRLAVDQREQGRGLGAALLKDCLLRVASAADVIGIRALMVHAKGAEARAFYERFDFEPSPLDELQLFLLMKDLRAALRR